MARFSELKLQALGFHRRDLGEGLHDYVLPLYSDWSIEVTGNLVELVYKGNACTLRCDNEQKLEQLMQVL